MKVGLLFLSFRLYGIESVKQRRSVVKHLVHAIHQQGTAFAVCEVGESTDLRRAALRVAHVSDDVQFTDSALARCRRLVERGNGFELEQSSVEIL
jgi:uncharacterized protein YlxP (DUF503 family)